MEKQISVTRELESLTVGQLEGQRSSGIFLSPSYLDKLRVIHNAAVVRASALPPSDVPDALKRLVVTLEQLFVSFDEATIGERSVQSQTSLKQLEEHRTKLLDGWTR
jgi:hypothetical protein